MRPSPTRLLGLAAAGLAWLLPAAPARAQFPYGYDSYVNVPAAQNYYAGMGYAGVYSDPTTAAFMNGSVAPPRAVAPYANPPFGNFPQGSGLPYVSGRPAAAPVVRQPAVRTRRGLLGRKTR